jgi:hypothetical protein
VERTSYASDEQRHTSDGEDGQDDSPEGLRRQAAL